MWQQQAGCLSFPLMADRAKLVHGVRRSRITIEYRARGRDRLRAPHRPWSRSPLEALAVLDLYRLRFLAPLLTRVSIYPRIRFGRSSGVSGFREGTFFSLAAALLLIATSTQARAFEFFWGNPTPQGNSVQALEMVDDLVGYAVGEYGTTLRTSDGGVTWEDRTQLGTFLPHLNDVLVDGSGALLAVGSAPGIFRSVDDGTSWNAVTNPTTGTLNSIFRVDALTLVTIGQSGRIYRSTDDGATWSQISNLGGQELIDQWWTDAQHGYIVGPNRLRRTTNGGTTWIPVPGTDETTFFPGDIQFLDANNGWILVDFTTFRTTNGGASWFTKHGSPVNSPIYQEEAAFLNAGTRWVCTEAEGAEIWKTTDDGLTWTRQYQNDIVSGITDLVRLGNGDLLAVSTAGDLLRSTDAGTSWQNAIEVRGAEYRAGLSHVEARADGRIFAAGATTWLQSDDHGRTWFVPASTPGVQFASALANRASTWYVGGSPIHGQSAVTRSTDDGATWQTAALSASNVGSPVSIHSPTDGTAFAATYGGSTINYVFRTTDSGTSWHLRNTGLPVNERFFAIFFLDASFGYVAGGDLDAGLWQTTDGGASWVSLNPAGLNTDNITDMYWTDSNTGVAAGLSGTYRTTNGGSNWTVTSAEPFFAIDFDTPLHGCARDTSPRVYETNDGGVTWQPIDIPRSLFMEDVAAIPGGFLTVGQNRTILGGVALDPASTPDGAFRTPSRIEIEPNPTMGDVRLRFESERSGAFRIRVFDAAGRMHADWMEQFARGNAEVRWQAPTAGAWFVQVLDPDGKPSTGRFVQLK